MPGAKRPSSTAKSTSATKPTAKKSSPRSTSAAAKQPSKSAAAKSSAAKPTASKSTAAKPTAKAGPKRGTTKSAAPQAKATATTARKSAAKTTTQAKSAATKTARAAGSGSKSTGAAAKAGAKATATVAAKGAKETATRAKATSTRAKSTDTVTITRGRLQEILDDAASRGRITRRDANDLVSDLMRRGQHAGDGVGELLGKGRDRLETATKKVRKAEPVDVIVRSADRARRAAGVGPTFPIIGYGDLNVGQVQARLKELSRPEQRKVLNYERKHANRKSIVGALEKSLG